MKGTILTFCIICFACAVFFAGIFLHHDEMQLDDVNQAMKRSIHSSMEVLKDREIDQRTAENAMAVFLQSFRALAPKKIRYSAGIYGFSAHPLLMRIKVIASDLSGNSYTFEETMVEEAVVHEK